MRPVIYNIPTTLVESYRGRSIVVRAEQAAVIVAALKDQLPGDVVYVQVLSPASDLEALGNWGRSVPVDVVVANPREDYSTLYKCSGLLANHPVRVSVAVVPGFGKAVKLATSLGFAVKLEPFQPDDALVAELLEALDVYLHRATVSEPVEFFHSLLAAFYHNDNVTIWSIQEDDPAEFRYVTEQGEETLPPRFAGLSLSGDPCGFVKEFMQTLLDDKAECAECEFLDVCCGYFKWPQREFRCDGVRSVLRAVRNAAGELRDDIAAARRAQAEDP